MTKLQHPYRCTGCKRRFPTWKVLRDHHKACLAFMARADGVVRSRATAGASERFEARRRAL